MQDSKKGKVAMQNLNSLQGRGFFEVDSGMQRHELEKDQGAMLDSSPLLNAFAKDVVDMIQT